MKGLVEQSAGPFAISYWARNRATSDTSDAQADRQLACDYACPRKALVLAAPIG